MFILLLLLVHLTLFIYLSGMQVDNRNIEKFFISSHIPEVLYFGEKFTEVFNIFSTKKKKN